MWFMIGLQSAIVNQLVERQVPPSYCNPWSEGYQPLDTFTHGEKQQREDLA
jgi:hypothetical protein